MICYAASLSSESGALSESDVGVELVSVWDVSAVVGSSPEGVDGDSVGVFCESNSIGPRTLGLSVCFAVVSGFVCPALSARPRLRNRRRGIRLSRSGFGFVAVVASDRVGCRRLS